MGFSISNKMEFYFLTLFKLSKDLSEFCFKIEEKCKTRVLYILSLTLKYNHFLIDFSIVLFLFWR